jgi:GNAT superfamily N-acetyltransferase
MTIQPILITITKLEMLARPGNLRPHLRHDQDNGRVMLLRARKPAVHFYRYLYETVGKAHTWVDRRRLSDETLAAIIHDDLVEIYTLYCDGTPAGYAELDFRKPGEAELAYFGIMPDFIGRGLGGFLLATAIDIAWTRTGGSQRGDPAPIERLWVHTNTLDHPRALPLYQQMGFAPYAQEKTEIVPLD